MTMTIPEAPHRGSSPARFARRRLRGAFAAAVGVVLLTVSLPPAPPAAAIPLDEDVVGCIAKTKVEQFAASGGPFMGGTRLDWKVTSPCPQVQVYVGGVAASRIGTVVKDPQATTVYEMTVRMGSMAKYLGYQVALGGDVVGYTMLKGIAHPKLNPDTPAGVKARRVANDVTRTLSKQGKLRLQGRTLEVHVIPATTFLTKLPPWTDLAGKMTCNEELPDKTPNEACVAPRPWSEVRGIGGTVYRPDRLAVAVGEEALVTVPNKPYGSWSKGHSLVHELGHAMLDFAAPHERSNVTRVLEDNDPGHDYSGDDAYTKSTPGEYFAEGTAAMFGYEFANTYTGEYTQAWLAANEPKLYTILKRVYPGA